MRALKRWVALLLVVFSLAVSLSALVLAASGDTTVYITKTGEKYHSYGCQYLRQSCISISLSQAVSSGYGRCSKCSPPYLDQPTTTTTPATTTQSSSGSSSSGGSSGSTSSSGSSGSGSQQSTSASSSGFEKKYTQYEYDMAVAMAATKARDEALRYHNDALEKAVDEAVEKAVADALEEAEQKAKDDLDSALRAAERDADRRVEEIQQERDTSKAAAVSMVLIPSVVIFIFMAAYNGRLRGTISELKKEKEKRFY